MLCSRFLPSCLWLISSNKWNPLESNPLIFFRYNQKNSEMTLKKIYFFSQVGKFFRRNFFLVSILFCFFDEREKKLLHFWRLKFFGPKRARHWMSLIKYLRWEFLLLRPRPLFAEKLKKLGPKRPRFEARRVASLRERLWFYAKLIELGWAFPEK